jgi:hypothetical protein
MQAAGSGEHLAVPHIHLAAVVNAQGQAHAHHRVHQPAKRQYCDGRVAASYVGVSRVVYAGGGPGASDTWPAAGGCCGRWVCSPGVSKRHDRSGSSGMSDNDTGRQAARSNEAPASFIALQTAEAAAAQGWAQAGGSGSTRPNRHQRPPQLASPLQHAACDL